MAQPEDSGDSVTIKLFADENIKELRRRIITLTRTNDTVKIGRSSKVPTKGFVPASGNAWFDSPVMSRNHAEIVADIDNQSVYLRDTGSLHGTFVKGEQLTTGRLTQIADGSKIRFGLPITRNLECFAPATIEVGITHYRCPPVHRNQTAGSTFALPEYVDDESSSSDGDAQEQEADNIVSDIQGTSKPTAIVDLTEAQQQVDMVDLTDEDLSASPAPESEHLIDLTSPLRAASPDMEAEEEEDDMVEEDVRVLNVTSMTLDNLMDNSDKYISDVESRCSEDSDDSDQSINLGGEEIDSTNSEASDEIIDDVDHNRSDDDEGSNSESENADWDAEYDSDDDVLDHDDPDTAGWTLPDRQNPPVGVDDDRIYQAPSNMAQGGDMAVTRDMPPTNNHRIDHPCAFGGPYMTPYYPVAENSAPMYPPPPVRLPSLANLHRRQVSPSDAALPKRYMHFTAESLGGSSSGQALGAMTGKQEFFAAREVNKARAYAPFGHSPVLPTSDDWPPRFASNPLMSATWDENQVVADNNRGFEHRTVEKPAVFETAIVSKESTRIMEPAVVNEPAVVEEVVAENPTDVEKTTTLDNVAGPADEPMATGHGIPETDNLLKHPMFADDEHGDCDTDESIAGDFQSPAKAAQTTSPFSFAAGKAVAVTPLLQTGDEFLSGPKSFVDLELPTYPCDDTDHEPRTAYELYKLKKSTHREVDRRTHVGISDIVHVPSASKPETEEQASEVLGVFNDQHPGKGKRKADEMEELTVPERLWEAGESTLMSHLLKANAEMLHPVTGAHADTASDNGTTVNTGTPVNANTAANSDTAVNADTGVKAQTAVNTDNADATRRSMLSTWSARARQVDLMTHIEPRSDERAAKRLRIGKTAGRLGYFALGGLTAGAGLVSMLIYTAPTFT
ncbi:hypothetical protein GE09DRAFT_131015 [Coniochaeta sp. 2T2.1]|nr:hypothetical protein GE09DRAFT_131015 [Coniochaeta sp. 2T2.1]